MHDGTCAGPGVARRTVLRGAAVAGLAASLFAACGEDGDETSSAATAGGGASIQAGDVPVGGGTCLLTRWSW
jgi:hypothetical protein